MFLDVLNAFNKLSGFIFFRLNMSIFFLCSFKTYCNINGTLWLKSQAHWKGVVASQAMKRSIIVVLHIMKTLIPSSWILRVLDT